MKPTSQGTKTDKDDFDVATLIANASVKDHLQTSQHIAARRLMAFDGEVYPKDGCAITASVLLQDAGLDIPDTYQAIALGCWLIAHGWEQIPIGEQEPGDIGSTCGKAPQHGIDHVYLVLKKVNEDEMVIADNQRPEPHFRWASGKGGKSPTKFFLRAP